MPVEPREVGVFNTHTSAHTRIKTSIVVIVSIFVLISAYFTAKFLLPCTITYEANGGLVYGEELQPDTYKFLEITKEPENVRKMGFYLEGWYKDKNFTKKYEFGKSIWISRTLYAKWLPGYALVLNYAEDYKEDDGYPNIKELREYYQVYVQPNTGSALPRIFNYKEQAKKDGEYVDNYHKGEQLLWFETEDCIGEPLEYKDFPILTEDINIYGRWYDTQQEKFRVDQNDVLQEYLGYCDRVILPDNIKEIKTILPDKFMNGNLNDQLGSQHSTNFSAFKNVLSSLKMIYINEGMTKLGDCSFKNCTALEQVVFKGDNVEHLGENSFQNCVSLTSIDIPSKITTIPKKCFSECSKLEKVVIGENVSDIKEYAFGTCIELDTITLPNVSYIEKNAFVGCSQLDKVYLGSSEIIETNATTAEPIFENSSEVKFGKFNIFVVSQELVDYYSTTSPWSDIISWQLPKYDDNVIYQVIQG